MTHFTLNIISYEVVLNLLPASEYFGGYGGT